MKVDGDKAERPAQTKPSGLGLDGLESKDDSQNLIKPSFLAFLCSDTGFWASKTDSIGGQMTHL